MSWIEWLGLLAALFVLLSFVFKNILIIRCVNLIGATVFVVYGLLIHSYSVWIMNSCLIVVQIYYIIKIFRNRRNKNESSD